ncbi:Multidrug resistance regulator 1 [Tolypocladium ophioglossoides CBS 100239]|uniref:Multidrug resistance regulator 1 n=1 Tax=Tolypocladium ophioglossoides (strain CBS 100239) TaxID=1163406 RepID=A0A0L0MZC0_TOLOC|nr:Multidrug resistance regulator 1 [Tolypocladium ophioglossoides CBS 100239]
MSAQSSQGGPSRKRRRQAVVCTECRRRKIACDRNAPCTQCIQSNSACTYYNSCSTSSDFSSDQDNGIKPRHITSSSAAAQTIYAFGPRPQLPTSAGYDHAFSSAAYVTTIPPTPPISVDTGASSWFDTASLGALPLPLSMSIDTASIPFSVGQPEFDGVTGMGYSVPSDTAQPTGSPSQEPSRVVFQKSRLYGPSHWMTVFRKVINGKLGTKYEQQGLFEDINSAVFHNEGHPVLQKCKRLARGLKSKMGPDPHLLSRPLREFMPSRDTADRLVQLYLRTFESVHRVLHVPTFQRDYVQYWSNPQAASECSVLQLLLVMAIGTCFYQDPSSSDGADGCPTLHEQSTQWIHIAHIRLAVPFRKKYLDLRGVQAQSLLVLALLTNTNAVGGDLAWITTASLVQSAMAIGLHLGPSQLPVSPLEAEVRRRLWATMLELAVQASLDSGMHPVIAAEALDSCELPSNLDDSQISESTKTLPASQPTSMFTQNSIQCALLRSLPIRLKIAETLSRFRSELPYDSARRMGAELTAALRETSELIDSFLPTPPSAFQIQLQDLLVRRFLLILHAQFAYKASSDVNYHFSRTVCLECSLLLLSPRRNSSSNEPRGGRDSNTTPSSLDDYTNLRVYGDGLFKNVLLAAALTVCAEILLQLHEDSSPAASSLSRRELLQAIEDAATLTRCRILRGETSVKAHVFFACVLAKIGTSRRRASLQHKPQTDQVVADGAKRALDSCFGALEARMGRMVTSGHITSISSRPRINFPESPPSDAGNDDGLGRRSVAVSRLERGRSPSLDDGSDDWLGQLANCGEGWLD